MDYQKPIETIEQAEVFFKSMDGSGFHMSREYPERYHEYEKLNIDKQTEQQWTQQVIDRYAERLTNEFKATIEWWCMLDGYLHLLENVTTGDNIINSYRIVKKTYKQLSPLYMIIIAETLLGVRNKYPNGCIYEAQKLGLYKIEGKFKQLAFKMVDIACKKDPSLKERGQAAIQPVVYDNDLVEALDKLRLLSELNKYSSDKLHTK